MLTRSRHITPHPHESPRRLFFRARNNQIMFADIILLMLLGMVFGTVTGLIPGIHPNTMFVLMLSALSFFLFGVPAFLIMVFVFSLAVSNTFTDFIPSIIFGAPDPDAALSVLPGHRMLLLGRGYEALSLTVLGGVGVASLTLLTLPVILYMVPFIYLSIRPVMHILLVAVVAWMVVGERGRSRLTAFILFLLSGMFGVVSLNAYPSGSMLFPAFTGLFAFSTLLVSYWSGGYLPKQEISSDMGGDQRTGVLAGWLAGWFSGMLPGVGAAQAGAFAARAVGAKTREFLSALGGINTSNILFTFVMFYVLGKTRSGATWAMSQVSGSLGMWEMVVIVLVGFITCLLSGMATLGLGRLMLSRLSNIPYRRLTGGVGLFLVIMVALLSGLPGLLAAFTGTSIGLLTVLSGVRRSHLMGFLLLPTMLYFSGASPYLMVSLGI